MQNLPLEGIRVVDFTVVWHGTHLSQWLGVMGAEVIKIETQRHPDVIRAMFPKGKERWGLNLSIEFAVLNYAKKSIALNMNEPKGMELAREIIKTSDVVTENFGGSIMERWGLGYSDLKKLKPDIIMYSGSGFGRTGPYKDLVAFAVTIEGFCGLSSVAGYSDSGPAMMASRAWNDLVAAQHGVFAILAALHHRSKTGEGQYIDLSMSEAMDCFLAEAVMDYTMNGRVAERTGNRGDNMAPHGCYRCRGEDKWVAIAVSNNEEWKAFCDAIGNPDWTKKEEFRDELSRLRNQDEMDRLIEEWTKNYTDYEAMEILQKAGVMAGASLDMQELMEDPHLNERDFFADMDHPEMGKMRLVGLPWRLSDTPKGNYQHAPLLGEHNDYVFGELLGMSKEEIRRLEEDKVIY